MSIIRVEKLIPGWEAIPNDFVNDLRLSTDAVAVGLWLAIKPAGWQVRPAVIQTEFSRRPGKLRGREWWARVSCELKDAGYMQLKRSKDVKGQFACTWDFCVFGLGVSYTKAGFASDGSAVHGLSDNGYTGHSNQNLFNTLQNKNTTHSHADSLSAKQAVSSEVNALLSAAQLSAGMRKLIEIELSVLTRDLQKVVMQEFIAYRSSIRNPVPWMRRVCSDTLRVGEFTPAKQFQSTQKMNGSSPEKRICEIDTCQKYAATRSNRGWRCVDHISR